MKKKKTREEIFLEEKKTFSLLPHWKNTFNYYSFPLQIIINFELGKIKWTWWHFNGIGIRIVFDRRFLPSFLLNFETLIGKLRIFYYLKNFLFYSKTSVDSFQLQICFVQHCENDADEHKSDDFGVGENGSSTAKVFEVAAVTTAESTPFSISTATCRWHATTFIVSVRSGCVALIFRIKTWANSRSDVHISSTRWIITACTRDAEKTMGREKLVVTTMRAVGHVHSNTNLAGVWVAFCCSSIVQLAQTTALNVSF